MAIGRIAMPGDAEAAIAEGAGDLVGMTRALIADADWPNRAREGRVTDIRPSSYDNFAWGEIHHLGRFALEYRGQFGESPSETLKRSRTGRGYLRPCRVGRGTLGCAHNPGL